MAWRYIAQRLPEGEFLDWDLPLTDVEVTPALNAPGGLTGTVPVEVPRLVNGPGGEPVLQPWRTAVWAEDEAGQIRGGGVLTAARVDQQGRLRIECIGLSGALVAGQPWTAAFRTWLEKDPLDIVREIYAHVQGQPGGDLGLVVDDTTSPVRVGTPEDPTRRAARLRAEQTKTARDDAKATLDKAKVHAETTRHAALKAAGLTDMTGRLVVAELDGEGKEPSKTKKNLWYRPSKNRVHKVVERREGGTTKTAWESVPAALALTRTAVASQQAEEAAKKAYDAAKSVADKAAEAFAAVRDRQQEDPFRLNWWSTHDLGKVIDDLAQSTPFDMVEHTRWTGDQLAHRLELAYPRRGRRRTDLRYVIGENAEVPREAAWGEDFATLVQVIGAGEGSKMVRALQSTGAVGVRRVHVHTDKALTKTGDAEQRARVLAPSLTGDLRIREVLVYDHPHAPVGAVALGDEIRLQGRIDWADIDLWLRVMAITYQPDQPAVIRLRVEGA